MCFFNKNKFLITCGINANSPILIYGVKSLGLLLST